MSDEPPRLVPELDVTDLGASLGFYRDVLGFEARYQRPEEQFAYLDLGGAHLMLQEAAGPGRRFRTAPLERPFGRGVNLQLEVPDVVAVARRVHAGRHQVVVELEERWYRAGDVEVGNHQLVVADPDGYLLRCFEDLGERPSAVRG